MNHTHTNIHKPGLDTHFLAPKLAGDNTVWTCRSFLALCSLVSASQSHTYRLGWLGFDVKVYVRNRVTFYFFPCFFPCLFVCLFVCLSVCLFVCLFVCLRNMHTKKQFWSSSFFFKITIVTVAQVLANDPVIRGSLPIFDFVFTKPDVSGKCWKLNWRLWMRMPAICLAPLLSIVPKPLGLCGSAKLHRFL